MGVGALAVTGLTALGVGASTAAVAGPIIGGLALGAGGLLATKLLSPGAPKAPPPPAAPTSALMPVLNQNAQTIATQQQSALLSATSGRMSTVLQQAPTSDKLGG